MTTPEADELTARACRAYLAHQTSIAMATGVPLVPWSTLSPDHVRAWEAAASAAHFYRPANKKPTTTRHLNMLALLQSAYVAIGKVIEAMSPPVE